MESDRVSTDAGMRARRAAVAAIALALAVDAAYLILLPTWHKAGQGAWQVLEVARAYPGLAAPDLALAALLLAALLVLTLTGYRRPQLVAALWALAGLTVLVVSAAAAWTLLGAIDNRALLSGVGEWRAVSSARIFAFAALLAAQCVAAALLLVAARLALAREWVWMGVRCVLALPLAWGVYVGLISVAWAFSLPPHDLAHFSRGRSHRARACGRLCSRRRHPAHGRGRQRTAGHPAGMRHCTQPRLHLLLVAVPWVAGAARGVALAQRGGGRTPVRQARQAASGGPMTPSLGPTPDGATNLARSNMRIKLARRSAGGLTGGRRARSLSAVR